jgi:hypothetical protein
MPMTDRLRTFLLREFGWDDYTWHDLDVRF